jgi:hypothetical protein
VDGERPEGVTVELRQEAGIRSEDMVGRAWPQHWHVSVMERKDEAGMIGRWILTLV